MPNPFTLAPLAVGQQRPQILYGLVSLNQPVPASASDPLYVILPQWDEEIFFTISDWPMCHGLALPQAGAIVTLLKDTTGTLRCVYWEGTYQAGAYDNFGVPLTIGHGGTGSTTKAAARANLGITNPDGLMNYVVFTSNGTWTIPSGVTQARIRACGGGGGGGGGQGGPSGNGAGGAAAGAVLEQVIVPSGDSSLTITVGSSGTGGSGGAGAGGGGANGAAGTNGGSTTVVGTTSSTTYLSVPGGQRGAVVGQLGGGQYGNSGQWTTVPIAGDGGFGDNTNNGISGHQSGYPFLYVVGGGAGGGGISPHGGAGGSAQQASAALAAQAGGGGGNGSTNAGGTGQTATMPGCGGGGGGGGLVGTHPGGDGGDGGGGGAGQVEIWW